MDTERMLFLYLMSIYPNNTFDSEWKEGCYYCLPGAQKKWGIGCLHQQYWELPIKITLLVICVFNILRLVRKFFIYPERNSYTNFYTNLKYNWFYHGIQKNV